MRSFFSDLIKIIGSFCAIVVFFTTKWEDCLHFMVDSRFLALSDEGVSIVPIAEISFYIKLALALLVIVMMAGIWAYFKGYRMWANDYSLILTSWLLSGVAIVYGLSSPLSWFQIAALLLFAYAYVWISVKVGWILIKPY